MSIIDAVRDYVNTYTGLVANAPLWVDFLGAAPGQYGLVPMPGSKVVETYLDGSSLREFQFAFRSAESTADNLARLSNIGFYEAFSDWMEQQSEAGVFPTLAAGKTPEKIETLGWGYLYEQGESETGIYQISCRLTYMQD